MTVCDHTGLTKPECHCPACIAALVAAHAPHLHAVERTGGAGHAAAGQRPPEARHRA
jgi:hypothetical protein